MIDDKKFAEILKKVTKLFDDYDLSDFEEEVILIALQRGLKKKQVDRKMGNLFNATFNETLRRLKK